MKQLRALLGGALPLALGVTLDAEGGCPCQATSPSAPAPGLSLQVQQEYQGSGGLSTDELQARYGDRLKAEGAALLAANASLACLDDRIDEPVLGTPGGELGEFTTALAAYLREKDGPESSPSQEVVESLLAKYIETVPSARPVTFYTDEKALHRVEALLPTASLDLEAPSEHQLEAGLLERLAEPESQGDRHFRYLLEQPSEYGLPGALAPMVLKAFYQQLWRRSPKLRLRVLRGESDPQAFLDVSCRGCVGTPALKPSKGPALVSQLSAPAPRRAELARLFARASRSTSRKVGEKQLLQRIEELGFLALEKTGSRMAAGLPFYSLTYS